MHVLVMDDDVLACRAVTRLLVRAGLVVTELPFLAEVETLTGEHFDVVIGDALAMALSLELFPQARRVLLTVAPWEWTEDELEVLDVSALLQKPWSNELLVSTVLSDRAT